MLIVSLLAFMSFQLIPGDPTTKILGTNATQESVDALRSELKLDRPVLVRYAEWLTGFVTGDLGRSYNYKSSVQTIVAGKLGVTVALSGLAFLLVVLISIPLGLLFAWLEGKTIDKVFTVLNQIAMSFPPFLTGIIFNFVFGLTFRLFTPGKFVSFSSNPLGFIGYLFFPALAIALPRAAMAIKLLRRSVLTELRQDYIRTAYSRGNSRAMALRRHALRNAVIPLITFLAATLADIVTGSIVIEQIFLIPGIGRLLLSSILNRDYPVVQLLVVIIAFLVISANCVADIAYQYIDPRIRIR